MTDDADWGQVKQLWVDGLGWAQRGGNPAYEPASIRALDPDARARDRLATAHLRWVDPETRREDEIDLVVTGLASRFVLTDAQTEIDNAIRATVGDAAFAKYENYEKTFSQRSVVNQLEQRLSYSSTPLSTQQSEQMVAIIAATGLKPKNHRIGTR